MAPSEPQRGRPQQGMRASREPITGMCDGSFRPGTPRWLTPSVTALAEPRTTVRWPLIIVLATLAAVAPVATDLYLPGFPAMGEELGASASEVQLTLTTFLVGLATGQLLMGPL